MLRVGKNETIHRQHIVIDAGMKTPSPRPCSGRTECNMERQQMLLIPSSWKRFTMGALMSQGVTDTAS